MQKLRWFARTVLLAGNGVALVLLVQDAAQQVMHNADDDRVMMPYQNVMIDDDRQVPAAARAGKFIKGRRQQQQQQQQQQQLLPSDHVLHPMQRNAINKKKKRRRGQQANIDPADLLTSANFTHYLIHIPKAGGTYARHQLGKDLRDNKLSRRRGILCDKGVSPVTDYANWPTYYDRKARDRLAEQIENARLGPGREAPKITKSVRQQCSMYMTESHFSDVPQHVYSIIRDPREHIVSAYFHCKESKHHGKKLGHLMPDTLEEWLNAWVKTKRVGKAQALKRMEGYRCYNPINMQSSLLLSPASPPSYGEESAPVVSLSKETLAERFDVLGLTSQMDKSLCLIFIRWTGIVPDRCNCSQNAEGKEVLAHHGAIHSHNVTNHGGTHEHTKEQLKAIEELADVDMKLYAVAEELFAEQVAEVERKFSIKLC